MLIRVVFAVDLQQVVLVVGSHAVALGSHKFATLRRRRKVGVLVRLATLFTPAHLALVEGVARSDGVFVGGHSDTGLALLEHRAAHRLLRLLPRRWCIDHLLRLKEELVHATLLVAHALDGCSARHPVHIVGVHRHLLGVDELVHHRLGASLLGMAGQPTMVRTLGVVSQNHLLGRGSSCELRLNLTTTTFALRSTADSH